MPANGWIKPANFRWNWRAPKYRAIQAAKRTLGSDRTAACRAMVVIRGQIERDLRSLRLEVQQLELEALLSRPA